MLLTILLYVGGYTLVTYLIGYFIFIHNSNNHPSEIFMPVFFVASPIAIPFAAVCALWLLPKFLWKKLCK